MENHAITQRALRAAREFGAEAEANGNSYLAYNYRQDLAAICLLDSWPEIDNDLRIALEDEFWRGAVAERANRS